MLTFDSRYKSFDSAGLPLGGRFKTADGKWVDSTGAFLVGELERLDQTLNMPLMEIQYTRDIDLREDVTIADEYSSYTQSQIAAAGGLGTGQSIGNGKSWIGKNSTQIASVSVDIDKIATPLYLWGEEVKYTIPELESAAKTGRPIDAQKIETMEMKHQADTDEMVYIGDTGYNRFGLVNAPLVYQALLPKGVQNTTSWFGKSPDEILADINQGLTTVWKQSAWKVKPNRIGLPPDQFGYISTAKVATAAGNMSILRYILENNLLTANGNQKLEIVDMKWLLGAGAGGTLGQTGTVDRMLVYTKDKKYVRYPKTLLARTPIQYEGLYHKTTYYCRLGGVEMPYPETLGYFDF